MSLFTVPQLWVGFISGASVALVVLIVLWAPHRVSPLGGVVWVATSMSVVAVVATRGESIILGVVGVGGVAVVAAVTAARRSPVVVQIVCSVPFGLLIGRSMQPSTRWAEVVVTAVVAVGAPIAAAAEERWFESVPLTLVVSMAMAGIAVCVPDTEEAAAVLGATVAFVPLEWPLRRMRLGPAGAAAAVALAMWVAAVDGASRPASIVASVGCLSGLLALGVTQLQRRPGTRGRQHAPGKPLGPPSVVASVCALTAVFALISARVGGLSRSVGNAVGTDAVVFAAAVVMGVACVRTADRQLTTRGGSDPLDTSTVRTTTSRRRTEASSSSRRPPSGEGRDGRTTGRRRR